MLLILLLAIICMIINVDIIVIRCHDNILIPLISLDKHLSLNRYIPDVNLKNIMNIVVKYKVTVF